MDSAVQATSEISADQAVQVEPRSLALRMRAIEYWMRVASPPQRWPMRKFMMNFTALHPANPGHLCHRFWTLREMRIALEARMQPETSKLVH